MYRYSPGSWHGLAAASGIALLPEEIAPEVIEDAWERLRAGEGLPGVLTALTATFGTSLTGLPSFGVVVFDGDAARVAVRGPVIVSDGAELRLTGEGVSTWHERLVESGASLSLIAPGGTVEYVAALPLVEGAVLCTAIGAATAASRPQATPVAAAATVEAVPAAPDADSLPTPPPPLPPVEPVVVEPVRDEPVVVAAPDVNATLVGFDTELTFPELEPNGGDIATAEGAAAPSPLGDPAEAAQPEPPTEYDELFGATVMRSVEGAAVRPPGEELIDAIPLSITGDAPSRQSAASSAASAASVSEPDDEEGDHDGLTVSAAQLRAMRAGAGSAETPPVAATAAGVAIFSTGERVTLDKSVVVGRKPRAIRATGDLPHLLTVPSPEQDISRSHLELRVEGNAVLAVDLDTTNGTLLTRRGADPMRLHPGEPAILLSGDVLDLGDSVTITMEGLA